MMSREIMIFSLLCYNNARLNVFFANDYCLYSQYRALAVSENSKGLIVLDT